MKQYINYFLNYLQTEKDAASSTIHKYRADLERLFEYLKLSDINEVTQNHLFFSIENSPIFQSKSTPLNLKK